MNLIFKEKAAFNFFMPNILVYGEKEQVIWYKTLMNIFSYWSFLLSDKDQWFFFHYYNPVSFHLNLPTFLFDESRQKRKRHTGNKKPWEVTPGLL